MIEKNPFYGDVLRVAAALVNSMLSSHDFMFGGDFEMYLLTTRVPSPAPSPVLDILADREKINPIVEELKSNEDIEIMEDQYYLNIIKYNVIVFLNFVELGADDYPRELIPPWDSPRRIGGNFGNKQPTFDYHLLNSTPDVVITIVSGPCFLTRKFKKLIKHPKNIQYEINALLPCLYNDPGTVLNILKPVLLGIYNKYFVGHSTRHDIWLKWSIMPTQPNSIGQATISRRDVNNGSVLQNQNLDVLEMPPALKINEDTCSITAFHPHPTYSEIHSPDLDQLHRALLVWLKLAHSLEILNAIANPGDLGLRGYSPSMRGLLIVISEYDMKRVETTDPLQIATTWRNVKIILTEGYTGVPVLFQVAGQAGWPHLTCENVENVTWGSTEGDKNVLVLQQNHINKLVHLPRLNGTFSLLSTSNKNFDKDIRLYNETTDPQLLASMVRATNLAHLKRFESISVPIPHPLQDGRNTDWIVLDMLDDATITHMALLWDSFARGNDFKYSFCGSTASSLKHISLQRVIQSHGRTMDIMIARETQGMDEKWLQRLVRDKKMSFAVLENKGLFLVDHGECAGVEVRFFNVANLQDACNFNVNDANIFADLSEQIVIGNENLLIPILSPIPQLVHTLLQFNPSATPMPGEIEYLGGTSDIINEIQYLVGLIANDSTISDGAEVLFSKLESFISFISRGFPSALVEYVEGRLRQIFGGKKLLEHHCLESFPLASTIFHSMSGHLTLGQVDRGARLLKSICDGNFDFTFSGPVAAAIWIGHNFSIYDFEIIVPEHRDWKSNLENLCTQSESLNMEPSTGLSLRIDDEKSIIIRVFPVPADKYPEMRVIHNSFPVIPVKLLIYQQLKHLDKFPGDEVYQKRRGPMIDQLHGCVKYAADNGDSFDPDVVSELKPILTPWIKMAIEYFTPITDELRESWEKIGLALPHNVMAYPNRQMALETQLMQYAEVHLGLLNAADILENHLLDKKLVEGPYEIFVATNLNSPGRVVQSPANRYYTYNNERQNSATAVRDMAYLIGLEKAVNILRDAHDDHTRKNVIYSAKVDSVSPAPSFPQALPVMCSPTTCPMDINGNVIL